MPSPKVEAAKAFLKRHAPAVAGTAGAGLGFAGGYAGEHDFDGRKRTKAERIRSGVTGAAIYGGTGYLGTKGFQQMSRALKSADRHLPRGHGKAPRGRAARIEAATKRLNQTGNDWAEETAKELKDEGKNVFVQKGDMTKQNSALIDGFFDELSEIYR